MLVLAYVVVGTFLESLEELLQAAQGVVHFSGLDIMRMGNLIPCHFEVPNLLLELQVIVMARVDIKVFLEWLLLYDFDKHGAHEVEVDISPFNRILLEGLSAPIVLVAFFH